MRNKYILLRHGETKYQAQNLPVFYPFPEKPPISLTAKGKQQIKKAIDSFDEIYKKGKGNGML